ncbi:type II toxin-antitoxin system HipA family toxin [Sulfurimonas sp. SAG-AH-194-C21]|nr:type II toxin-antitoxin system HipA family toxin [Sulfurimonas sp. SAG-AH-194-C21]MDF1883619.1 type II toxin-antitoxin system HipA family toxin [Sulfurimonas sp. SAG-AH-194-C21]
MKKIDVLVQDTVVGELFFEKELNQYGFNYLSDIAPISLIMPYQKSTYMWKNKLHPIFDMNTPEGYLFEVFKNLLHKEHSYIDDFLIFSYLAPNIESRLSFTSWFDTKKFEPVELDDVLKNDSEDTFLKILHTFLNKNAISGVQPKTLVLIKDKESLGTKEYIIKTWGEEYKNLAENEFFCLNATKYAGVEIPNIQLSQNKNFLLVERFNYDKESDSFLGFEEVLVLLGKNTDDKYSGSYERVAKTVYAVTTDKLKAMKDLYKCIVMSYLLKNGDAHLKNFGILYDEEFKNIRFAPAYDIVNTCVYIYKDKPALTMFGKKLWFGENELVRFGVESCYISKAKSQKYYDECIDALKQMMGELKEYIKVNPNFENIGSKMQSTFKISLEKKTHKELSIETTRDWN